MATSLALVCSLLYPMVIMQSQSITFTGSQEETNSIREAIYEQDFSYYQRRVA